MHVRCTLLADSSKTHDYKQTPPTRAAEYFCGYIDAPYEPTDVVVEPLDDEAKLLLGWRVVDGKQQMTYRVDPPTINWKVTPKQP